MFIGRRPTSYDEGKFATMRYFQMVQSDGDSNRPLYNLTPELGT